jgi:hypothetical protein
MATQRTQAQAPDGFRYVTATREENAEWRAKHKRHTSQYRLVCTACGKRIWGSGLGIGAHRRACPGHPVEVAPVAVEVTSAQIWNVLLAIEAIDPELTNAACRSAFDTLSAEHARLRLTVEVAS